MKLMQIPLLDLKKKKICSQDSLLFRYVAETLCPHLNVISGVFFKFTSENK